MRGCAGGSSEIKEARRTILEAIRDFFESITNTLNLSSEGRKLLKEAKKISSQTFTAGQEEVLLQQLEYLLNKAKALRTSDGKSLLNEKDLGKIEGYKSKIIGIFTSETADRNKTATPQLHEKTNNDLNTEDNRWDD